jgi:beta-lactamase superfamily II metal-dependent hydrolase
MAERRPARRRPAKKKNPVARPFWIVIIALAFFAFYYSVNNKNIAETIPLPEEGEIRVCFLDVGQGDSTLIQTKDNTVLIDAREYSARNAVLSNLRDAGVGTIDILVATHPHDDHIGAMAAVVDEFDIKQVLMPDAVSNTKAFENLLDSIEKKGIEITVPSVGDQYTAGIISLKVLAPEAGPYADLNNASIVLRMLYGDTAFLFTGDAEAQSENAILSTGADVRASVLKVGHHGSDTSTTEQFLDAVSPAAAVISCGKDNQYGHPTVNVLERLISRGIAVYRTDELGSLIMVTDGTKIDLYSKE